MSKDKRVREFLESGGKIEDYKPNCGLVETVDEYLARNGEITRCEYVPPPDTPVVVRCNTPPLTAANMSLAEGAHYYGKPGDGSALTNMTKPKPINKNSLPPHLRKYVRNRDE